MKIISLCTIIIAILMNSACAVAPESLHTFTMKSIEGKEIPLSAYKGKVLLVVNVASHCGYTKQYADLEKLYRKYKSRGFEILGFPANNFGEQEPGTDEEIREFCSTTYDVSFPMFSKISVKGDDQHGLYKFLTGSNPAKDGDVSWNFEKFLVDKNGAVIGRYKSKVEPLSEEITGDLEAALK